MTIQCPQCGSRYRIDPTRSTRAVARIKCPQCANVFEVSLEDARGTAPSAAEEKGIAAPALAPPEAIREASVSEGTAGKTPAEVLVVDDAKFFREVIADVLKPLQLTFLMAADGTEALQIIRQRHPALIILDLNLPGMNGRELIRVVRSDPSLRGIRLLAMSGVYRTESDAAEVQAAGADDFISKSFKPEQLQNRVRKLLSGVA